MGSRPVTNTEPSAMSPPTVRSPDSNTAARWRLKDTPTWCGPVWLGASPGGIQLYSDRMPGQRRTSLLTREVSQRAHLDRGGAGQRMRRGYLDGRVQVRALDHVVAAHLLLGLRVRAVGDQTVAVTDPDDPGQGCIAERAAVQPYPPVAHLVHPRPDGRQGDCAAVGRRFVFPEHQHVPHGT